MPPVPVNKKLYQRVKEKSNRKFKKSSLVRSKWIVDEYVREGGHYRGKRSDSRLSAGFKRWNNKNKHGVRQSKTCKRGTK
jgi:hypothetical protein